MADNHKKEEDIDWVYTPYITKKGKRIYPRKGKYFRFPAKKKP